MFLTFHDELLIAQDCDACLVSILAAMASLPDQAKVLCENSDADVEWLLDKFSLDLSLVARLGDHSVPRTHRGKERFPGINHHLCFDSGG